MADKHLQYRSDLNKHLIKTASGHLANECVPPVACTRCAAGTTKRIITIVFAGLTICPCSNWPTRSFIVIDGDPNGTFTVTQTGGDPCIWTGAGPSFEIEIYTGTGCGGAYRNNVIFDTFIYLDFYSATSWVLEMAAGIRFGSPAPEPGRPVLFFKGFDNSTHDDCTNPPLFNNDFVVNCCLDPNFLGAYLPCGSYGGTATLST